MDSKSEEEPEKRSIKGARKRKSATITRIIQNKIIEPIKKPKLEYFIEEKPAPLKEPEQRITLIERALGSFNASTDEVTKISPLNLSIASGPPFTCLVCKSWFFLGNKLKLHYVINHDKYHCSLCSLLFDKRDDRDEHERTYHSIVQCEICQDEIGSPDIWFHYDEDHDAVACIFCGIVLKPKSCFVDHFSLSHKIRPKYLEDINSPIAMVKNEDKNFFCALCNKYRGIDIFFGHMRSFHKITTTQLLNILCKEKINLTVNGTTVEERIARDSAVEEILPIQNPVKLSKQSCEICQNRYNNKVTAGMHNVYCQQKVQCFYCYSFFENDLRRKKHNKKNHPTFQCTYCNDLVFYSEEKLNQHYLTTHDLLTCRYCEETLNSENSEKHLLDAHNYTANVMQNFTETLFEVTNLENHHIVICCLCEDNITSLVDNVPKMFDHFINEHNVSSKKILRLITPKPSLSDYEDFYKEINKSIDTDSEYSENESTKSDDDKEVNNKENETLNKVHGSSKYIFEIDPGEIECLLDLDIAETIHKCIICNIDNIHMLDYVIHMKEKHKLLIKFKEFECTNCSEILLSESLLDKHIATRHCSESIEKYDCQCGDKINKFEAQNHILEQHSHELLNFNSELFGFKCQFCDNSFWERTELNEHNLIQHLQENEKEFLKCPKCQSSFSDQV